MQMCDRMLSWLSYFTFFIFILFSFWFNLNFTLHSLQTRLAWYGGDDNKSSK